MSLCQAYWKVRLAQLSRAAFSIPAVFIFLTHACTTRSVPVAQKRPAGIFHVVKRGENLFRIGKAYGVPYTELAAINRIVDPAKIDVGQRIFIPAADRLLPVAIITPEATAPETEIDGTGGRDAAGAFIWPVAGITVSNYGPRAGSFHDGIDISAPEGTPIRAVEEGEVIYSDQLRGYGNLIIIRHRDGLASVYSHNRKNLVREGEKVAKGKIIGEVGSTGRVSGPHLHFEVRKNNKARDPLKYLPPRKDSACAAC